MSKFVTIPTYENPFVVYVNGKKYSYEAGANVLVPDEVAFVIETHYENHVEKEQAREDSNIEADPDVHAKYFNVTDDGVASLKPEYRGATDKATYVNDISDMGVGVAGSKNAELPKHLIVPEIVDEKAVCSLALAMFRKNLAVVNVTLPSTITEISERCFDGCNYLRNIYNTENIKSIGARGIQNTRIERIRFPSLETFGGAMTFNGCGRLVYADIGKVSALPNQTFANNYSLHMVKSASPITSAGMACFCGTPNLKCADWIPSLTSIGDLAFLRSGVDYDWASLSGCTFGANATPLQYSPTDYWSNRTFTACENPLPTFLFQDDERWKDRNIGTTSTKYSSGCVFMTIMHAYCGLHNLELSTVMEFEEIVNGIAPNWLNNFSQTGRDIESQIEALGLKVDRYGGLRYDENGTFDDTILQKVYDALAAGKYVLFGYNEPNVPAHMVTIYGVNENGDFLIADSSSMLRDVPKKYVLPVSKLGTPEAHNNFRVHIVSL